MNQSMKNINKKLMKLYTKNKQNKTQFMTIKAIKQDSFLVNQNKI